MSIDYDKIMSYLKRLFKSEIGEPINYNDVVEALQSKSEFLHPDARTTIEMLSLKKPELIILKGVPAQYDPGYIKYTHVTILPEGLEKAVDSENPTLGEALEEARSIFPR